MNLRELKSLAQKYYIRVKGSTEEGLFEDYQMSPSKRQYINALSKLSEKEIRSGLKATPSKAKKKRKRSSFW